MVKNKYSNKNHLSMIGYILIYTGIVGYFIFARDIINWIMFPFVSYIFLFYRFKFYPLDIIKKILRLDILMISCSLIIGFINIPYKLIFIILIMSIHLYIFLKKFQAR